jgi:hypothetical protein
VTTIKHKCEEDARRIALEKSTCEADLAKAQPFVDQADAAISSIKPAHIQVRSRVTTALCSATTNIGLDRSR